VSAAPKSAPYGSWSSPITAEQIATGSVGLGQIALDARDIYWSEMRSAESGRYVIVRLRDGVTTDVLPAPFSARTRVHEYGGGAFTVATGVICFSNDGDQCLYRLPPEGTPQPITPQDSRRYADAAIDLGVSESYACAKTTAPAARRSIPLCPLISMAAASRSV